MNVSDQSEYVGRAGMHVLVGIHASGKSTIGAMLRLRGFAFFTEVAIEIIGGHNPWEFGPLFDELVIAKELERDAVLRLHAEPYFVETWHLGNLAYARLRNPHIAAKYEGELRERARVFEPRVYFLDVPVGLIAARTTYFKTLTQRMLAVAFFSKARDELLRVFDLLCIDPFIINTSQDQESVLHAILSHEATHCPGRGRQGTSRGASPPSP